MMKHYIYAIIACLMAITMTGCKSNQQKANELIGRHLSKVLFDYKSYEPIETTVNVAMASPYNSKECWGFARKLSVQMIEFIEANRDLEYANESMEIWTPSKYSSSYSDSQYFKYSDKSMEAIEETAMQRYLFEKIASEFLYNITLIDTTNVIGWEIDHKFRCKTKGGSSEIAHYRYVVDKDFKNILFFEEKDKKEYNKLRRYIDSALSGDFDWTKEVPNDTIDGQPKILQLWKSIFSAYGS